MNVIVATAILLVSCLVSGLYIYFGLQRLKIESKNNKRKITKSSKRKANPYAICRSRQKRYRWSEEKYKRCVAKIKAKQRKAKEKEELDYEEEMADDSEDTQYGDLVPKILKEKELVGE